jgi:hypothetical protein
MAGFPVAQGGGLATICKGSARTVSVFQAKTIASEKQQEYLRHHGNRARMKQRSAKGALGKAGRKGGPERIADYPVLWYAFRIVYWFEIADRHLEYFPCEMAGMACVPRGKSLRQADVKEGFSCV